MSIPLDVSFGVTYITPMTQRTSPLAVTRTAAGWNVCHKATGLVVLAAAACPTRAMARKGAKLLLASTTAFTAPSPSSIDRLPTVVNAVIRTLGAARRRQLAPATVVLGQVAA